MRLLQPQRVKPVEWGDEPFAYIPSSIPELILLLSSPKAEIRIATANILYSMGKGADLRPPILFEICIIPTLMFANLRHEL